MSATLPDDFAARLVGRRAGAVIYADTGRAHPFADRGWEWGPWTALPEGSCMAMTVALGWVSRCRRRPATTRSEFAPYSCETLRAVTDRTPRCGRS